MAARYHDGRLERGTAGSICVPHPQEGEMDRTSTAPRTVFAQIRAASTRAVDQDGSVLIIGNGKQPASQREFASQIPGAVTVEAVDLRDMVGFARELDFGRSDALARVHVIRRRRDDECRGARFAETRGGA